MKKLMLFAAVATMTVSASAQTVTESKTFDNVYLGINGGLATKTTGHAWMKGLDPNFGVRLGRYFTPVFGMAVESNAYFSNKPWPSTGTAVRALNTSLLGTVNLTNWFTGYLGEPRLFEISTVAGIGWGHVFTNRKDLEKVNRNRMTSKVGLDFTFNFGSDKQWQFYVEPSMNWALLGKASTIIVNGKDVTPSYGYKTSTHEGQPAFNIHNSFFQVNAGIVYKFKNSNATHNFAITERRNQAEVDALNDQINKLRNELAQKPKEIVKEVIKIQKTAPQVVKVENLVFVTFAQGKAELTREAKKALKSISTAKHVQVVGTASPEGSQEINDKLSQARADVVAKYLQDRGVIVDEATGKGVQGNTSNRLAVVYVK